MCHTAPVSEDEDGIEPRWGEGRPLSLGWPEPLDSLGIRRRLDLLDEIRPLRGGRILDVGCGNGSYTERLTEGFDTVAGVEVEPDRLAEFQRRVSSRPDADRFDLRLETAEALSDPDGSFDAVIAIETLEHVVDDVQAAAEAFRVLRRGGGALHHRAQPRLPLRDALVRDPGARAPVEVVPVRAVDPPAAPADLEGSGDRRLLGAGRLPGGAGATRPLL